MDKTSGDSTVTFGYKLKYFSEDQNSSNVSNNCRYLLFPYQAVNNEGIKWKYDRGREYTSKISGDLINNYSVPTDMINGDNTSVDKYTVNIGNSEIRRSRQDYNSKKLDKKVRIDLMFIFMSH